MLALIEVETSIFEGQGIQNSFLHYLYPASVCEHAEFSSHTAVCSWNKIPF